jgi:tetratricopeptide (TPR) repeat protein
MQYKGTTEGAGAIARSLGVTHILEGSVRQAAGRVRIVAQLIDARTDEHRWAETYDRDLGDIFAIQSDVANRVARALEARLTTGARARLAQRPTTDMDAYDLYLRGRFAWNRRTAEALQESVRLLRRATELDPGYAVAWAALADSHIMLAIHGAVAPAESLMPARAAAARALDLDPELAEALNARACVAALFDFDFAAAEQGFAAAIRGNPQYATAYQWQAMHLHAPLARFADGRRALDTAHEIEPLSPAIRVSGGVLAYYDRRFDAAVEQCAEVLTTWPSFGFAWYITGLARLAGGDASAAEDALLRALELSPGSADFVAALATTHAAAGDRAGARERLVALQAESRQRWVSPVALAQVHVALGELDDAMVWLERARALHAPDLVWIGVRPSFDGLRDHPDFAALLSQLGLPNARASHRGVVA